MLIIVLSLLCISIPLIVSSYKEYVKAQHALIEIQSLGAVADLANKISRERGPSNKAMSSSPKERQKNLQDLKEYRKQVDQQIASTFQTLKQAGFTGLTRELKSDLVQSLSLGRQSIDQYIQTPFKERQSKQLDDAILKMFQAWDSSHELLKNVVMQSQNKDSSVANYYTQILILADLRDQAGRVASNVMAYLSFSEPQPSDNIARSLQTQKQVRYLWDLVNTIQPEQDKTPEFILLHQQVKTEFIDQGLPIVMRLIDESRHHQPYYLTGTQLTDAVSNKFLTVINLQKYLLESSVQVAKAEQKIAQQKFLVTLLVSIISLMAALFTMIYAQRKVFAPLIQARNMIVELSYANARDHTDIAVRKNQETYSLYDAMEKLQNMLKQRDAFEFQLKNIANTDKLTGVSNRLFLDEYLKTVEYLPQHFDYLSLIIIDIDNFKRVNDQYGHIFGDSVIVSVAESLKENVRSTDLIIRFGGDEFLVVIDQIGFEQALISAEKIRESISALDFQLPESDQKLTVSVSVGVAVGAENWIALLEKADKSLFKAKAQGKNVVAG